MKVHRMDKVVLLEITEEVFRPLGFKRKGSSMSLDNDSVIKVVTVEKSNFGNSFSITYGIIVKAIPRGASRLHLGLGLPEISTVGAVHFELRNKVKKYLEDINTEEDVLRALKELPTLNIVPVRVREYFGLSVD